MKLIDNWIKFFQYLLKNYWTKKEIAQQIANIEKLGIQVVQSLPPASQGKDFTVYLVPIQGDTNNVYQEYLRINGAWELIGTTAVDLSNYIPINGQLNSNINLIGKNNKTLLAVKDNPSSNQYMELEIGKTSGDYTYSKTTLYCYLTYLSGYRVFINSDLYYKGHDINTQSGIVTQNANGIIKGQKASQNSITTIPSATSAYTLSIGEFNHTPDSAVTYTLPTTTSGYSNEIVLQVSFANTTSISFSGTYEFDKVITPDIDDDIIYLIRYSEIKQKWIIYPMI